MLVFTLVKARMATYISECQKGHSLVRIKPGTQVSDKGDLAVKLPAITNAHIFLYCIFNYYRKKFLH
jgi:hypothetical protein